MPGSFYFAIGVLVGILMVILSVVLLHLASSFDKTIKPVEPFKKTYHVINKE